MNQPIVSIITPTYNHEKYIADCIESVLAQTYHEWEMIIVDDGGTDSTYEIALRYSAKDSRIKVFTQNNKGIFRLSETYNFALEKSVGKYIAVLEGDDVWFPEKLELQVAEMEKDDEIVLSWGKAYSSSADLSKNLNLYPIENHGYDVLNNTPLGNSLKKLTYTCFIPALTVVVRKSSLTEGFIQKYGLPLVDLPTWQYLALKGKFHFIDTPIGKWRIYPNQITKTHTALMAEGFYKLAIDLLNKNKQLLTQFEINQKKIDNYFLDLLVINYSRSGRYKLIRKDFKGARKDYYKSIFKFGLHKPIWKLRSLIGISFSIFNKDIEGLNKKLGRINYK